MARVDSLDRKLLYALDVDSRQSVSELAKKLKVKPDIISARIKHLISKKIIKGFRPVINVYNLGYHPYRLSLTLRGISAQEKKKMFAFLSAKRSVGWLVECSGRWNMSVVIWAKDIYEFQDFISPILRKYGKYIGKKKTAVVHKLYLYSRCCFLGDENAPKCKKKEIISEGSTITLDRTDWSILEKLGKDSRVSANQLSKELKMSPAAVNSRIKKLIDNGVIHGFRISPDHDILGIKYYKVYFRFSDYPRKRTKAILDHVRKNPFVVYIDEAFGGGDMEVEFQVNNEQTFLKQLYEIVDKFSDIIGDYEIVTFSKEYKFRFMPPYPKNGTLSSK